MFIQTYYGNILLRDIVSKKFAVFYNNEKMIHSTFLDKNWF